MWSQPVVQIMLQPGAHNSLARMTFLEVLFGRRSRRFLRGAKIEEGPLAYESREEPLPLTQTERLMVLLAVAGNTGWNYLIPYNAHLAPNLPGYANAAGGRTFPSAAGFHTTQVFFTDDEGIWFFDTKDAPNLTCYTPQGDLDLEAVLASHRERIRKLSDRRLYLPPADPHVESHNRWVVNRPGSLLVIPVADLAEHHIANLCYYLLNGFALYDDVHNTPIPGLEAFESLYDRENLIPLSYVEQYTLQEATTELVIGTYAGSLMLQAMGLGGWMFNGINPYSVLGASGDPEVPGLGFRYDTDARWTMPNPTGLAGVFEGHCPPHFSSMRAAVEDVVKRKFGSGGPFSKETPGPWQNTQGIRSGAPPYDEMFIACVAHQAQYICDRFGRFPGLWPSMLAFSYLQAHHLDLGFYDHYFQPGAYLKTHQTHMENWH